MGSMLRAALVSTASVARHEAKGVVKSIDTGSLVITRSAGIGKERLFVLTPSTHLEGNVRVGSTVEVRFRIEAKQRIATVVSVGVQEWKREPPPSKTSSR